MVAACGIKARAGLRAGEGGGSVFAADWTS